MRARPFAVVTAVLATLSSCLVPYDKTGEGYACASDADCRAPLICLRAKSVCGKAPAAPDAGIRLAVAEYTSAYPYFWTLGAPTHEVPSLGRYDFSDTAVVRRHLDSLRYAGFDVAAFQWYGPGTSSDSAFLTMLEASKDAGVGWVAFYKSEWASGPKSAADISAVLARVATRFATAPGVDYLHLDGGPALFVDVAFNADACEVIGRWNNVAQDAGSKVSLVMRAAGDVATNPGKCAAQPWSWYTNSNSLSSVRVSQVTTVMPGFWANDDASPKLVRNPNRFAADLAAWVDGGTTMLFVNSFNGWLDGTAVETSETWKSDSGHGLYLDALHSTLSR